MLRDNRNQLVGVSVQGQVSSPVYPSIPASPYLIGADGQPQLLPSPGGIVYNVKVGDTAYGWLADMVQPGVSVKNPAEGPNYALNTFACLGNEALVVSGSALGARGTVIGKSGRFAEHVICHFADTVLEQLAIEDKVLVRAFGRSLAFVDYADIQLKSVSPQLLDALEIDEAGPGAIAVPVAAEVPAVLIGAGSGLLSESGCVQIQTDDSDSLREHDLDSLRLGDVVAISDYDSRWGNGYRQGATSIGVVVHGDSPRAGYGPGITIAMTAVGNRIRPVSTGERNIAELLGLRTPLEVPA
jgi:Domain of unknown function (DUF4438)